MGLHTSLCLSERDNPTLAHSCIARAPFVLGAVPVHLLHLPTALNLEIHYIKQENTYQFKITFSDTKQKNNDCVHIDTAIALKKLVRNHCSKMGEYMLYQALYMYTPVAVGELALKENDILEVPVQQGAPRNGETVLAPPTGWLRAFNTRTGIEGYVRKYSSLLLQQRSKTQTGLFTMASWLEALARGTLYSSHAAIVSSLLKLISCNGALQRRNSNSNSKPESQLPKFNGVLKYIDEDTYVQLSPTRDYINIPNSNAQLGGATKSCSTNNGGSNHRSTNYRASNHAVSNYIATNLVTTAPVAKTPNAISSPLPDKGTTKTLLNHLQKHPGKYKEFLDENNKKDLPAPAPRKDRTVQQNIQTMLSREKMVSSHPYAQTTTNKITNMLVKGLLPYSFVEEEGFVELVKHFAPNYKIPARTTFSRNYLAVDDSKSECPGVKKLLQKAKNIVGHYRRSSQARERLHSLQERMQVPQLELIQYVETRWSSEYCMLQRLVEMKGPIAAELAQSEHNIEPLTNADWAQAKGVLEVLEPLAQATKEISGDSYPTSSMVIPILHCLSSHLNSRIQRQEEANLSTALRNELYRDFEEMDSTADEPEPSTSNSGLWSFFDSLPNERKEMNISEEVEKYLSEPRQLRAILVSYSLYGIIVTSSFLTSVARGKRCFPFLDEGRTGPETNDWRDKERDQLAGRSVWEITVCSKNEELRPQLSILVGEGALERSRCENGGGLVKSKGERKGFKNKVAFCAISSVLSSFAASMARRDHNSRSIELN
uniref:Uncharacterized protein n=1 Tax=Timema cristinae TaxID=61476 RepID=A0A7R9GWA6_TIMCR|nr:unnamed protein product [Timema cristinae]